MCSRRCRRACLSAEHESLKMVNRPRLEASSLPLQQQRLPVVRELRRNKVKRKSSEETGRLVIYVRAPCASSTSLSLCDLQCLMCIRPHISRWPRGRLALLPSGESTRGPLALSRFGDNEKSGGGDLRIVYKAAAPNAFILCRFFFLYSSVFPHVLEKSTYRSCGTL